MRKNWPNLIAGCLCLALWSGSAPARAESDPVPVMADDTRLGEIYENLEIFAASLAVVEDHYVDSTESQKLIYGALRGMLSSLDPYSQFLDPASHEEIKVETEGKFGGIGVEIAVREGMLTVISALDDTPAQEAGLLPDDKITRIDGEPTRDLALDEAVSRLRGNPGTVVALSVLREGESRIHELKISRDHIRVQSVKTALMLDRGLGYIRISEFQENTPRDFERAVQKLERDGLKGLIIDVRNNPGGLFPEAVKTAEVLVPKGKTIVSTRGRTPEQNAVFVSEGISARKSYPIAVLVNRGTASASEILAGALKDNGLAKLVGTQTFGKGSVQTVVPLKDGSAIRLTTSHYFTPSGLKIQDKGLLPDVEMALASHPETQAAGVGEDGDEKNKEEQALQSLLESTQKEWSRPDKTQDDATRAKLLVEHDPQLQKALELLLSSG